MFDERDDREMGGRAALEADRPDSRLAGGGSALRLNKTIADAPAGLLAPPQRGERPAAEPKERPAPSLASGQPLSLRSRPLRAR
jgi:hypothetical protein